MLTPQQYAEAYYAARGRSVQLLTFFYCTSFDATQAGPITNQLAGDRDSDFVLCDVRAVVSVRNPDVAPRTFLVTQTRDELLIRIGESGRTLTDVVAGGPEPGVNIVDLSGWADRPFVFYEPVIVTARTVLEVTLWPHTIAGTVHRVDVAFGGMKAISGPL